MRGPRPVTASGPQDAARWQGPCYGGFGGASPAVEMAGAGRKYRRATPAADSLAGIRAALAGERPYPGARGVVRTLEEGANKEAPGRPATVPGRGHGGRSWPPATALVRPAPGADHRSAPVRPATPPGSAPRGRRGDSRGTGAQHAAWV